MINKKQILLTKIDLLNISLEAIVRGYTTTKTTEKLLSEYDILSQDRNNKSYNFIRLLIYIQQLKIITQEYSINIIASNILKDYTKNNIQWTTNKYSHKFSSIYTKHKKKDYYKNKKLLYNTYQLNIRDISILNLYIFTKITRKNGIFALIKYFYK